MTRSSESETTSSSSSAEVARLFQPGDERAVLGDVVGRDADRLAAGGKHGPVVGLEYVGRGGRPRVSARAAVREEPDAHAGGSTQLVEVERRLLVRMRRPQRGHDLRLALDGIDGLEPDLGDALLPPGLAQRRRACACRRRYVPVPAVYQEQRS